MGCFAARAVDFAMLMCCHPARCTPSLADGLPLSGDLVATTGKDDHDYDASLRGEYRDD